jgi:hypothetical protein
MALLSGLHRVPWASLRHAGGSAGDVPELLRALIDPDAAPATLKDAARLEQLGVREYVQDRLWNSVYHQGAMWPASAPTVPFLAEMLRVKDAALRRFVLEYLRALAESHPEDRFPAQIDPARQFAAAALLATPALEWQRDCYRAVEQSLPAVLFFVDDADEEVALLALALVASFPSCAWRAVPRLRPITKSTKSANGRRAGTALVTLAQLLHRAAAADAERALQSVEPIIALHAACAAVLADAAAVGPQVVVALTTLDEATARVKTPLCGSLAVLAARCLARLPSSYRTQAIYSVAQRHIAADTLTRLALTGSLLAIAFGDHGVPARAAELDLLQRYALETVRDHGGWTISGVEFGNYTELMEGRGLPGQRDALAQWLAT